MGSSRLAFLAAWPLLLGAAGCAHLGAPPPEPVPAGADAPSHGPASTTRDAARARTPRAPDPGAPTPSDSGRLDPSEVMTPEELATIPDPLLRGEEGGSPVPGASSGGGEASETRSDASGGAEEGPAVWRVQILATPDRALADRTAAEAVERLGTTARVDLESSLFKVRLGGFATEREAQGLRERAIEMGYPGAFRVKSSNSINN